MTAVQTMPGAVSARWNTPRILRTALVALSVGVLVLMVAAVLAVQGLTAGIKTVGLDTAPSIISAQYIKSGLADMDANLANELIGKPGENPQAYRDYLKRRTEVLDALVTAAQNITYGDKERRPILTLQNGIADYEGWAVQSRLLHERGDAAMLAAFRHGTDLMHQTLLPAAEALDKANSEAMESVYGSRQVLALLALALFLGCALLLLAGLARIQLFLAHRVRRLINPGLLSSTALILGFTLHGLIALRSASEHLRAAKKDAFDSVHALWQARAMAYDANGDESRWLLDKPFQQNYERAFFEKSGKVITLPAEVSPQQVAADAIAKKPVAGFKGMLADELKNITYPGEAEAATGTLVAYQAYFTIDAKIRQAENSGNHAGAVALCIGNNVGESNWAFEQFDNGLSKTLQINQDAFDEAVKSGFRPLNSLLFLTPIVTLAAVALTIFGLTTRLKEYLF